MDDESVGHWLYTLEGFAMTARVLVPLDIEPIEYAIADTPYLLRKGQEEAINDRRFAEFIYGAPLRAELWSGSPTKTRLPKPADVRVKDCSPEMWCV